MEKKGRIEVICGSMFSGKTEELIRRLRRAKFAKLEVEIFKPALDKRYNEVNVVSHNANAIPSVPVNTATDILPFATNADVVGIDEAQFFDQSLVSVATQLANQGVRVIIAGLDMDFMGKPFGPIPALMAVAEEVTKVHAICMHCGGDANHSFRKVQSQTLVLLGEKESYEPLCRRCFTARMADQNQTLWPL